MKKVIGLCLVILLSSVSAFARDNHKRTDKKADPSKRCERMISELKLDEKQAAEFRKINDEFTQKAQKEREEVKSAREKQREKMMAIREDRNAQMKKFLTDEQYKLYTEKQQSHKKQHKGNRNQSNIL